MRKASTILALAILATTLDGCTASETTGGATCDRALEEAFTAWAGAGFSGAVAIAAGGRYECLGGWGFADEATGERNTARSNGTGLGLPIAHHIAQAHGGTLTLTSPGPAGDGCAFRLTRR